MFLVIYVGFDQHKQIGIYRIRKNQPQTNVADDIFVEVSTHEDFPSRDLLTEQQTYHILVRCRRCRHYDCEHALCVQQRLKVKYGGDT